MTSAPKRIQRKRTKGWRMPAGAVYVGRPSRFANCWRWDIYQNTYGVTEIEAKQWAVQAFQNVWEAHANGAYKVYLDQLRGKDLACWCTPGQPCHADVLLRLANKRTLDK